MFKDYLKRMYIHIYQDYQEKQEKRSVKIWKNGFNLKCHRILMKLKVNIYSYLYISLHYITLTYLYTVFKLKLLIKF